LDFRVLRTKVRGVELIKVLRVTFWLYFHSLGEGLQRRSLKS